MRRLILSCSAFLLCATGARAQHEHHGAHHATAKDAKLVVHDDAATQTLTLRVGPLNLPAHSDHMAVAQAPDLFLEISFDGWITAYHPRLIDHANAAIPGRLLHHVAFWNTGRSDFLCPNKEEHIFGAGGEMNDWPALPGFGYRVRAGERIRVNTMFHNPTSTSYPRVYLQVRIEYQHATVGVALKSVYPTWFDVQQCGNSGYDLKAGPSVTTGHFTVPLSGVLLGVGGHLHDYGQRVELVNVTRNEIVATLDSQLDPNGLIQHMPIARFDAQGGYRLNRGEKISVRATYDNRTGKLLPDGAMGIVVGYFLPENDAQMAAFVRKKRPEASRAGNRR